ncbi:MAG TPA: hypothetical protein V6C65_08470, partial [Allocoleopsis sp.]
VKANPCFVHRLNPLRWEMSDHRFEVIESLRGKDPGTWTEQDLRVAFENTGTLGLEGGIEFQIGPIV